MAGGDASAVAQLSSRPVPLGLVTATEPRSDAISRNDSAPGPHDDDRLPVKMLNDRILVAVGEAEGERRSTGGILIPATAQVGKRLTWAEVVAVGPNVRNMEKGDRVLFNPEDRYEGGGQGPRLHHPARARWSTRWPPNASTRAAPACTCSRPGRSPRRSADLDLQTPQGGPPDAGIGCQQGAAQDQSQSSVLRVVEGQHGVILPCPIAQLWAVWISLVDQTNGESPHVACSRPLKAIVHHHPPES